MPYIYFLFCLVLLSCNSQKPDEKTSGTAPIVSPPKSEIKYVNSVKITAPEKNETLRYQDKIAVSFSVKEKFTVDSVQLFWNGKLVASRQDTSRYDFIIPPDKTGTNTLKIITYHPDRKRGVAMVNVLVKPNTPPERLQYKIEKVYHHDPKAYTQGLVYQDGFIYEGTGQYGESGIRKSDMSTGKIHSALNIDSKLFGEGITIYKDKIYQLTWTSRQGFIYDLKTFSQESIFTYNTQGWGLTTMGDLLIMSDGSNKLYHIAPSSFNIIKEIEVYDDKGPVKNLNELEYINGLVWANVWMQDRIVIIDPETGVVKQDLDMSRLLSENERNKLDDSDDVLNGIAWNPEKGTVYLTGKRWPKMFEIKVK